MENIRSRSPFLSFRSLESSYFNPRVGGQFTFDSCPRLSLTLLETRGIRLTCNIFDIVKIELFQIPVYFFFIFPYLSPHLYSSLIFFPLLRWKNYLSSLVNRFEIPLSLCREYLPRRYCVWLIRYLVIRNPFLRMVEMVIHSRNVGGRFMFINDATVHCRSDCSPRWLIDFVGASAGPGVSVLKRDLLAAWHKRRLWLPYVLVD